MRSLRPLLVLLCLLVPLAVFAAGCGDDEGEFSVSAAEAADATRAEDAAKVKLTMKMNGAGLPVPITLKGDGVTAIEEPRMDLTFDLGSLLSMVGAQAADGKARLLVDGRNVWIDPPAVEGLNLPEGAEWVTADLAELLKAMGVDASGFGELFRISPDQQIAALKASGSVKEVGKETIDGEETVHLRGTVQMSDYLKELPAERRAAAEKALEELEKLPGGEGQDFDEPTPIDVWVGEDKLIRRVVQKVAIPAQQGVPAGDVEVRMDLSEYGTKLDVQPPAKDKTYDATDDLSEAMKQQGVTTG